MEGTVSWRITRPLRAVRRAQRTRLRSAPDVQSLDSLTAASVEHAVALRLEQCSMLFASSAGSPSPGIRSLDESLAKLEAVLASTPVPHPTGAWLALLCLTGSYPLGEDVEEVGRSWVSEGPHGVVEVLTQAFREALRTRSTSADRLDIVRGQVVVDVTRIASSDLHTGVQRVAREAVTRWVRNHPSTCLAFFDSERSVFRLLQRRERPSPAMAGGARRFG